MGKKITLILFLVFTWSSFILAQSTIKGTVTNTETGEPLIAASVSVKGTTQGVMTDIDGNYTIKADADATTLVFSYVGYTSKEVEINGQTVINASLSEGLDMEEVVVVGYGTQKKSNVTGSISQVKSEDLEDMQIGRVEQALQGRTSGVRVTQSSGAPGSGSTVRIRGTSSINGSNPLFVVDGVVIGGGIDYLNPNDIASMEVLKDAASAAIYGARGANGVIIITTKGGKKGQAQVNYNAFYGVQNPWKKIPMLNASEYATIQNEMATNAGLAAPFANPEQYGQGTDWQDEVFYYNAPISSNEINVSGGSDNITYYSSVNYFQQDGIVAEDKSNYKRLSARLNLDAQVTDKLKVGINAAYTRNESRGVAANTEFGSPLGRALNIDPITPLIETDPAALAQAPYTAGGSLRNDLVLDPDGNVYGISPYVTSEVVNPVAAYSIANGLGWADKFVSNVYGEFEIIKNLKVRSSFGSDLAYWGNNDFTPAHYLNTTNVLDTNFVGAGFNRGFTWIWDNTITYDFNVQESHNFSVLAGHSAQSTNGVYLGGNKRDVPTQNADEATIDYARNEDSEQVYGGFWERYAIESYFSRVNYNYQGKYMLTAIMRADASSNFGPNYRWGYFPSVSAGWNITDEDFFPQTNAINYMKLRTGWGRNGNDAANALEYVSTVGGGRSYTFGSDDRLTNGVSPNQISNSDLRWETVEQINVGVDLRLFKHYSVTLDAYIQNTIDMKTVPPLPAYIGNNAPTANVGTMTNKGIDLELGYDNSFGDLNLNVKGNVSYVKNEVTVIGNEAGFVRGAGWGTQNIEITRITEGLPIGYLFGYTTDGIFQNQAEIDAHTGTDGALLQPDAVPGDIRFVDVNGDGAFDEDDRGMIGDPTPTWTYGFTVDVTYKGFDLVIFGQGISGNSIFNATRRYDLPLSNMPATALGRWTGEGTSNDYPRLTRSDDNINLARSSSFYVESGSFFRIKTAQIGYTLPRELTQRAGIGKARLYVASNNLLTITDYSGFDPEIDSGVDRGSYPQARQFSVGVNVTFN
ncbi:MAG: SusC/RagA family TonB-linked outer membrane protein [Saprospiraceae bacterium]